MEVKEAIWGNEVLGSEVGFDYLGRTVREGQ